MKETEKTLNKIMHFTVISRFKLYQSLEYLHTERTIVVMSAISGENKKKLMIIKQIASSNSCCILMIWS